MKTYTINDSRINRNNDFSYYTELSRELVKTATGLQRDNLKGCTMSWDEFKAVSYKHDNNDVQIDVVLDFNTNSATITVEGDIHQEPEHTEKPAEQTEEIKKTDNSQKIGDKKMEKFNTLQDVANYINNTHAEDINWIEVAESITASGFVDDTAIEDGICHKGDEKVVLSSEGEAKVWPREQTFTAQFFDKDGCDTRDDIHFEEWSNNDAIKRVKIYLANDMWNSAYAILRDDEGTIVATIKDEE